MTGDQLTDATLVSGALSIILPPIVSYLRGRNTPKEIIGLIVFGLVMAFTALSMFVQDQFLNPPALDSGRDLVKYYVVNFFVMFGATVVSYQGLWKTLGATVTDKLEITGPHPGADR